jgi:glycosyltransferase involved in cell wall biosynthesis
MKLSIIVPYVNEFPQVLFTIRNLGEELYPRADFEIIAVNNYCPEVEAQAKAQTAIELEQLQAHLLKTGYKTHGQLKAVMEQALLAFDEDRGGGSIKACSRGHDWLTYVEYKDKLSHWNAKRVGCEAATGDYFLFIDSHCIVGRNSIYKMFNHYVDFEQEINGSLHLPLTYKILEWHRLIYKLVVERDANNSPAGMHYSFTSFRPSEMMYRVPCMSTCGMMISRKIYDKLGGWPKELGIYGGGENFMNYTLSVLGYDKWIYPEGYLCHHGEKRGYHWNYDDHIRNRILATFLFGGEEVGNRFISIAKGRPEVLKRMLDEVKAKCRKHRDHIKSGQVMTIDDWVQREIAA